MTAGSKGKHGSNSELSILGELVNMRINSPPSLQVAKSGEAAASLSECFLLAGADSEPP